MDRTSFFILLACFFLLFSWGRISNTIWPPQPLPASATNQVAAASSTNAAALGQQTNAAAPPVTAANAAPDAPVVAVAATALPARGPEKFVTLETEKAIYTFTSHGGGIKQIGLKDYPAIACATEAEIKHDTHLATLNTNAPLSILTIRGSPAIEGNNEYALSKIGGMVVAEQLLSSGLRIVKEYRPSSTNYLLSTQIRFENATNVPVALPEQEIVIGTAAATSPGEDPNFQGGLWSNGSKAKKTELSYFANKTLGCFGNNPKHYLTVSDPDFKWAAVYSQFFAVAAIPTTPPRQYVLASVATPKVRELSEEEHRSRRSMWEFTRDDFAGFSSVAYRLNDPTKPFFSKTLFDKLSPTTQKRIQEFDGRSEPPDELLDGVIADFNALLPTATLYEEDSYFFANVANAGEFRMLAERKPAGEERARFNRILIEMAFGPKLIRESPKGFQASYTYGAELLAPNQTNTLGFSFFTGPKEYYTLSKLAEAQGNDIDKVMNLDGFFGMFSKLLLLSMTALHNMGLPYGLCIVGITVIIKLIFWPLTQSSTRSMKRMAKLQPEMKKIQEKYKDDPRKGQVKTMEFMREKKINPLASCLPMLVQIPFFIGFFMMIKTAIELRGASFLWACDLSSPDTIFIIPGLGWIPFLGIPGVGFPVNPMPILMSVSMIYQMRLTPQSPTMDATQQKIFKYMPVMFMFILYGYSSGLTLYWTVNNILSIIQTKLVKNEDDKTDPAGGGSGTSASAHTAPEPPKSLAPKGASGRKGLPGARKKKKKNDPFDPANRRK